MAWTRRCGTRVRQGPWCPPSPQTWTACTTVGSRRRRGTRAAPTAMAYAKEVVRWLEFHGAKVVNGVKALDAEASKSLQMMYLNAAGCNTPFTVLAQGRAQAATEAFRFVDAGVMVKPNTGGSGAGIDAFETGRRYRPPWPGPPTPPRTSCGCCSRCWVCTRGT